MYFENNTPRNFPNRICIHTYSLQLTTAVGIKKERKMLKRKDKSLKVDVWQAVSYKI